MKKIGMLALLMIGLVMTTGLVAAWGGWQKDNDAVKDAIDSNDFKAWKTAMIEDLTEERFNQIIERHENMPENMQRCMGKGMERGTGDMKAGGMKANPEVQEALESGDFDAWVSAHTDMDRQPPFEMTEENFNLIKEIHEARESGDRDRMDKIKEELGIERKGLGTRHRQGGYYGMGK